jgi:hypothetical protein
MVLLTLRSIYRALCSIDVQLRSPAAPAVSTEHDTLSPVFNPHQVQQARIRSCEAYVDRQRLEHELLKSPMMTGRAGNAAPSPELLEQMRKVCEALVESECAWKEYAFMIEGNIRVALRGERGAQVVQEFKSLCESTRGSANPYHVGPNRDKLARVEAWIAQWSATLAKAEPTTRLSHRDVLFREVWEDGAQWHWQEPE